MSEKIQNQNKGEKIKLNASIKNKMNVPKNEESKIIESSNHQSEWENSELKETADFFRPSPTSFESKHKRFSFGRKGEHKRKESREKNQMTYIEHSSLLMPLEEQQEDATCEYII